MCISVALKFTSLCSSGCCYKLANDENLAAKLMFLVEMASSHAWIKIPELLSEALLTLNLVANEDTRGQEFTVQAHLAYY